MRNVSGENCSENQTQVLFLILFSKIVPFVRQYAGGDEIKHGASGLLAA